MTEGFDLHGLLPFDDDADAGTPLHAPGEQPRMAPPGGFWYLGQGLTPEQFLAYVATYDFGTVPPDYIVIHHTALPAASWGPYGDARNFWDANEQGKTIEQKKGKRKKQLDNIMIYYRDTKKWDRGPHIFVDELFIWLFTPMREVGIHAAEGNSYIQGGRLHYSVGIEVVGYFEKTRWSEPVARNVGLVVGSLKKRLNTFELVDGPWAGKVGSHRMYNKPACPGAAIVPSFYLSVYQAGYRNVMGQNDAPREPPAPIVPATIVGSDRTFRCGAGFKQFYDSRGGLSLFGYPTSDEYVTNDSAGDRCTYMRFERCWLKYKPGEGVKLAPLSEVLSMSATPPGPFGSL